MHYSISPHCKLYNVYRMCLLFVNTILIIWYFSPLLFYFSSLIVDYVFTFILTDTVIDIGIYCLNSIVIIMEWMDCHRKYWQQFTTNEYLLSPLSYYQGESTKRVQYPMLSIHQWQPIVRIDSKLYFIISSILNFIPLINSK